MNRFDFFGCSDLSVVWKDSAAIDHYTSGGNLDPELWHVAECEQSDHYCNILGIVSEVQAVRESKKGQSLLKDSGHCGTLKSTS